jgi:hypothetical protein
MLPVRIKAMRENDPSVGYFYDSFEELSEDFWLTDDEFRLLLEGKDLRKYWAKKKWIISIEVD